MGTRQNHDGRGVDMYTVFEAASRSNPLAPLNQRPAERHHSRGNAESLLSAGQVLAHVRYLDKTS